MTNVDWSCDKCKAKGSFEWDDELDRWIRFRKVKTEHKKASPECTEPDLSSHERK